MSPPEMCAHIRLFSESEDRRPRFARRVCTTPTVPYPSSAKVRAIAMGSGTSPHVPRFTGFGQRHQRRAACVECAISQRAAKG